VLIPRPPLNSVKGIAMAIADGMTTSEGAKEASETTIHSFLEDYYCTPESWSVKTSAARVLAATNSWLYAQSMRQFDSDMGMVTTFTGAVVKSGQAHIFHVGDCRVSLIHAGSIERLTQDHRIRLSKSQDYLARALGVGQDLDVDYRVVPVDAGDSLVFTTDGVHDHIAEHDILAAVKEAGGDLDAAAQRLVALAHERGSVDNLTCQIVHIDAPGTPDRKARLDRLSLLPFPPELDIGENFEGYRILRELNASSRSQVYLGEDEATGEKVVLKTPSANHIDDALYIERFSREEWIGRLLASPHLLKTREPTRPRRYLYLICEYVEGRTLAQWLVDEPRPTLSTVRTIVGDIARGLQALHRKEMVHQDLKPDNIILDTSGVAKIIDFGSVKIAGIADVIDDDGRPGTIDYSAPDYLTLKPIGPGADLYSLGVITYEMLTGKHPYGGGFRAVADVKKARYVSARQIDPTIPAWVDAAIEKAVAVDPAIRYDALSAFVTDLSRPNSALGTTAFKPLIERNPVVFWRSAFLIMAAIAAVLFVRVLTH
jgi:serine/threonine protein phosphatase PrpC/tRNA A-37 threonylcarbamoyl transferase component Bud32